MSDPEDSVTHSSSDESIVREQAKKLFSLSDTGGKGFIVKNDLQNIRDLLPPRDMTSLENAVDESEEKFISQSEFIRIIHALTSAIQPAESPDFTENINSDKLTDSSSFQPLGVTLDAELSSAELPIKYQDPLSDIIKQQMEKSPYPFSVENDVSPRNVPNIYDEPIKPVRIEKPQFRPIQPAVNEVQSLADELNQLENPEATPKPKVAAQLDLSNPDRIFKVVFVGDSAVGKTCFLHRFCHNRFKPLFNATIGVDFTVKSIALRDRVVALQLWDTAGQERFRSITKQYFRKADGVVLMFDVTSEQSFLNVRNWVESVQMGVDENTVMCLVGNKVDLFGSDQTRSAVFRAGKRLAEEFNMPFFETSAFTGYGIEHCMRSMAESLQKREEDHLEEALRLEMNPSPKRRSWCCL